MNSSESGGGRKRSLALPRTMHCPISARSTGIIAAVGIWVAIAGFRGVAVKETRVERAWRWEDRDVDLWEVKDLPFTDAALGPVRMVLAEEHWEERTRRAGRQ